MEAAKRKDLKALIALLRDNGVTKFKSADVEIELHPEALRVAKEPMKDDVPSDGKWSDFPSGELSPEALAFYSSGGIPGEEPPGLLPDEEENA